jgi:hypothetical protein
MRRQSARAKQIATTADMAVSSIQPLKRAIAKVGINAEDDLDPFRPQQCSKEE